VVLDLLLGKETGAPQGEVRVYLTMPITSLMGMTDDPGILAGYGPIPARIAREIAAGGCGSASSPTPSPGWPKRSATPTSLQPDNGNSSPPATHRCDVDHCCSFDGTNTTVRNLRPKCRHHHRMKHESNWRCENLEDGRHVWTTPAGRVYETEVEPIAEPAPF
jgi:hypothetical protein